LQNAALVAAAAFMETVRHVRSAVSPQWSISGGITFRLLLLVNIRPAIVARCHATRQVDCGDDIG
jgi:hypothetical protein